MKPCRLLVPMICTAMLLGGPSGWAKDRTPEEVQRLLERQSPAKPNFVPGEVIVKMKASRNLDATAKSRLGVEEAEQRTSGGEILYRIPPSTTRSMAPAAVQDRTLTVVQELKARSDVEYAQPNWIKRIVKVPNDTHYAEQWDLHNNGTGQGESPGGINLPKAWETNTGGADVVVAVIDTGILSNHPDISGSPNLVSGFDMISDPSIANDGGGRDNDPTDPGDAVAANECEPGSPAEGSSWHGTHVAGTVGVGKTDSGAGVAGVNWKVKLQAVRVLGKCGGTTADINDGIRWAAGLAVPGVPNNPHPARVINMSLGTPPGVPCSGDPATQSAIQDAVEAGAVVVVAAGNDAVDASHVSPASCDLAITVAASDARGHLVTRYSNFGSMVEIMAPGGDVRRDDNGDGKADGILSMVQGGYALYNGTSMAAPHVAGVAALVIAEHPELVPGQVLAWLQNSALQRSPTQCPKPCGAGLLSAIAQDGTPPPADITPLPIIPPPPPATQGSIGQPGEKDLYEFQVSREKRYTVETHGLTDVVMSVFGPNSETTLVEEDDDDGDGSNAKVSTTLKPGKYRLQVRHYSPMGTGDYTVTVQEEP